MISERRSKNKVEITKIPSKTNNRSTVKPSKGFKNKISDGNYVYKQEPK